MLSLLILSYIQLKSDKYMWLIYNFENKCILNYKNICNTNKFEWTNKKLFCRNSLQIEIQLHTLVNKNTKKINVQLRIGCWGESDAGSTADTGWHKLGGILKAWLVPQFYPPSAYVEILATFETKMP